MRINQLPGCLDLFGCGMLAAWGAVRAKGASKGRWWASGVCLLALIALFWLLRTHDDATFQKLGTPLWQARWRLAIGALVALVAVAGSVSIRPVQLALANPILRFLGFVSYNLYLWHKVLADALFHARWPAPATKDAHDDPRWQLLYTLVAVGLSILAAAATTWGLEQPILRWGKRVQVRYNEGS
jgi:peptidoglycan/LPS O-acetylase OafA/YrhL